MFINWKITNVIFERKNFTKLKSNQLFNFINYYMKKIILSAVTLMFLVSAAQAQLSYGIKGGVNFPKLSASALGTSTQSKASTSFYLTGYLDAQIANNLSVQPGISLQGKGGKSNNEDEKSKFDLMYIEVPVNLVYYVPAGSGNLFLGAGPYAGFGISAKIKEGKTSTKGEFGKAEDELNRFDAGANFLLGYKLENGFLINGGYSLGLTNITNTSVLNLKNRVFSVGVGFQF